MSELQSVQNEIVQRDLKLDPYVPTAEELKGESWAYCYGNPVVLGPPSDERPDSQ